jgi:outer membrane protein assembly factor BamB
MKWCAGPPVCSRRLAVWSSPASPEGHLIALDARTGKVLWHFQTGADIKAPPISYSVKGKQYIALAAGPNVLAFHLNR